MKYLACEKGGGVVGVIEGEGFLEAYQKVKGRAVFLVELNEDTIRKISELEAFKHENVNQVLKDLEEKGYQVTEKVKKAVESFVEQLMKRFFEDSMSYSNSFDFIEEQLIEEGLISTEE